ncbi:MAG: class I SAM-dependent methyltransferase [Acidobacteriota bacterium]|nr:class I SAM-dependent methyltransferase [Acidobacteriota bacterium]
MEQSRQNITVEFKQEYFNTRFPFDPRRKVVWNAVTKYIQDRYIPRDARVLDLGAAYCDFINHVSASEKHALDVFERLEEFAEDDVTTHIRSCTDMSPIPDGHLDVIFASNLLEHLMHEELLATIAEVRRVLRPDGRLILLQPNFKYCYRTYFDDYTHLQVFTHMGIWDLLEMAGLEVEKMHARFLPVNMKSTLRLRLPFLSFLVSAYLHSPWKPRAGQMLVVARNRNVAGRA